jgi:hypothetical protein
MVVRARDEEVLTHRMFWDGVLGRFWDGSATVFWDRVLGPCSVVEHHDQTPIMACLGWEPPVAASSDAGEAMDNGEKAAEPVE